RACERGSSGASASRSGMPAVRDTRWSRISTCASSSSCRPRSRRPDPKLVHEALEQPAAARVAELAQGLGLDLADALARHPEAVPALLEGVAALLADAEAHLEHLRLARRERRQDPPGVLGEARVERRVLGVHRVLVLDEVAEGAVLLLA